VSETGEVWQERPTGGLVDASLLTKPWRDVLDLIHHGDAPQPPIAGLCGRRLIDLEEGQATLAVPASEWFCGPKGRLDTGIFTFLADMTHFYAVLSTLPAGAGCTTAELSMTFLGQPPHAGGEITARSDVVYADERNALAVGLVCDNAGRPVAHSTSRYFLFPAGMATPPRATAVSGPQGTPQTPDPIFRSCGPMTSPLDEHTLNRLSGLEILQAQLAGESARPPIDRLTGMQLTEASDGLVVFSLPAHGWLLQEIGTVFGGMIALLAKSATAGAVQAAASAGTRFTALDLKVNFLRAVDADGRHLLATGRVVHRGSRLTIANTEVTHGGRSIAIATGTTALTPPSSGDRRERAQ
jgi:uncharacterized protein (TIGR00369 family)